MASFGKLLLAIDLGPEAESLIQRVFQTCAEDLDKLHVIHVVRQGLHDIDLFSREARDARPNAHAQRLLDHTAVKVRDLLRRAGMIIPSDRIHLVYGEPSSEIKKLATELSADAVIVGSHAKDGDWLQLPGATTNCVMQGISSDVIAVKV